MGKLVQIRDVPEDVHRTLKARAAKRGVSLSAFVREYLEIVANRPDPEEVWARIESREPVELSKSAAEYVREGREEEGWL
ncbi:MAG: toxin-antitoxin system HicB family antitoxin [Thermoleophilaceae bacterium]|nr:toxin-antitoxin system HicB family antitoxin [Thermoleophilaceae bacterium]